MAGYYDSATLLRIAASNKRVASACARKRFDSRKFNQLDIRKSRVNVGEAIQREGKGKDFYFSLVDYRNENQVLKRSVMKLYEAALKNKTLEGTGLAWARQ